MDKPKITYAKLVLKVGTLCFFESSTDSFFGSRNEYFWKFENDTTYFGPFITLLDAGINVNDTIHGHKSSITKALDGTVPPTPPAPEVKNLIQVDFKTKRRIK